MRSMYGVDHGGTSESTKLVLQHLEQQHITLHSQLLAYKKQHTYICILGDCNSQFLFQSKWKFFKFHLFASLSS